MNTGITITEQARIALFALLKTACVNTMRLSVVSRGCGGHRYNFDLCHTREDAVEHVRLGDDMVLFIDPASSALLHSVTIDYVQKGLDWQFSFDNPAESARCGCGQSFRT